MARDGMRDVVLGDDGDQEADRPASVRVGRREGVPASPDVPGAVRRPSRRRWLLGLALLLVAVVAVTVVPGVRARNQEARLAPVPGVLSPLEPPLEPVWTGPLGLGVEEATREVLVAIVPAGDGYEVVGTDPSTGERLWATPMPRVVTVADSHCRILRPSPPEPAEQVVCHLVTPLGAGEDRRPYGPGAEQRLLVLDPRTGEPVADRSLGHGYVTVAPVGTDLVVTEVLPDGRVHVAREDPADGEERWAFRSDEPLPGAGQGAGPRAPYAWVQHGVVVVEGSTTWALSSEDGRVIGAWEAEGPVRAGEPPSLRVTPLPDGRLAVGDVGPTGSGWTGGHVLDADGRRAFPLEGPVQPLLVDDRSAADLLLISVLARGEIVALDAGTGEPRWSTPANAGTFPLVLDRRLVTTVGERVVAVDTGTGERLWTALDGQVRTNEALMPDGRVALVGVPDERPGGRTLAAVQLTDGRVLWTAPAPDGTVGYIEAGGLLLALHGDRVTRLG